MLAPDQLPITSRIFSSAVLQELARKGRSPLFAAIARKLGYAKNSFECSHVRDVFEDCFNHLQRQGHRDEYVYKSALVQKVLLGRHSLKTATLLSEFHVGACKADLAILNGTSTVYEVKSERDSLKRLERQLAAYSGVFARVNVLASETHVQAVRNVIPRHVGIIIIGKRFRMSVDREAVDRTDSLSVEAIFDSLRTDEARKALVSLGYPIPAVANTELSRTLRAIFSKLDSSEAHRAMVDVLKVTRSQHRLGKLLADLPKSLHTATLCAPLRKIDHPRLISAVSTELEQALAWG